MAPAQFGIQAVALDTRFPMYCKLTTSWACHPVSGGIACEVNHTQSRPAPMSNNNRPLARFVAESYRCTRPS